MTTIEDLSYLIQDKLTEAQTEYEESGGNHFIYHIPNIYANTKKMRTYLQEAEMFLNRNHMQFSVSLFYDSKNYSIEFSFSEKDYDESYDFKECDFDTQWYIGSLENDEEIICWSSYEDAKPAIMKGKPRVAQ